MRLALAWLLAAATCARPAPAPTPPSPEPLSPQPAEKVEAPLDVRPLFEEALSLKAAGDVDAARAKLDEVRRASPGFAIAALERAELLIARGTDLEVALEDALLAARLLPDNPRAWMVLGQAREESGASNEAIEAYRRSLSLRDDARLRRRLASLEKKAGHFDAALKLWESVRDEAPDDVGARLELADLYEASGRPASARAEWEEVERLAPANAHLLRRFADFLDRQGQLADARERRARAEELSPSRDDRKLRPLLPSKR